MVKTDIHTFPKPSVTVDIVIFTVRNERLQVLLVNRKLEPFARSWALPGGFVHIDESLNAAALRELQEEAGISDVYLEQLYTFGEPSRDARGRVITVSYMALVKSDALTLKASTDASDAKWFPLDALPSLAFDHKDILDYAYRRLRWKFEYTTVAFSLLPESFAISEVRQLYGIVFGKEFDKRNFTKKLLSIKILQEVGVRRNVAHRPARLYSLKTEVGEIIEILPVGSTKE